MATPTLGLLNHTEIDDADDNTGWINLTTADTDLKVEGSASMSGITRSDGEDSYYDHGSAPSTGAGKTLRGWVNTTNMAYMEDEANDGYQLWVSDGSTESNHITLFGSDTYFGGWFYFWQDMDAFTGPTLANVDRWGIEANLTATAKNVINMWMDVLRYLDGYYITGGTSGDEVTMSDVATADRGTTTLYGYGIIQEVNGVYFGYGELQVGNGATTTYFEMDGDVLVFVDPPGSLTIDAGLYEINAQGTGCDCVIKNSVIRAAGTGDTTRFVFDFSDTDATVEITDNLIVRAGASTFASGQTVTGNTFDGCSAIAHGGADMSDCVVKNYEGTAGTAALTYNVNADPDGEMDDMSFTKGTAATHCIELGSSTPSSITLRNWVTSGYNAADSQNDSTIYNNSGKAITINIVGGTGNFTYRDGASASTTMVIDPINVTVTAQTTGGTEIENANVFLRTKTGGTGPLPENDTVTIVNSGTLATVTHAAHGMASDDYVLIDGASLDANNGVFQITYIDSGSYSYTMASTPGSSPTGTIKCWFVFLKGLTDVNGEIDMSRSISSDQDVEGWSRKSSSTPYYKEGSISGTVSSTADTPFTATMADDE